MAEHVSARRLGDDLWRLVSVPSPTGDEQAVAERYAEMLREAGAEVEVRGASRGGPAVIARLAGRGPGRCLQLAGHLDHIDVPHAPPERTEEGVVGRGASDMKAGLAGIVEVVRLLHAAGRPFAGEVLVTAYGGHEAPQGKSEPLLRLIEEGVVGDAAIVTECDHRLREKAVIAGRGQAIWTLTLRRRGEVCHELARRPETDALLRAAAEIVQALQAEDRRLREAERHARAGTASLFIGQVHYGDFYNRVPASCWLQGTRRWPPGRSFQEVSGELARFVANVPRPRGIAAEVTWQPVGEAYEVNRDEAIMKALRGAYRSVTGRTMAFAGTGTVFDANRLVPLAGVPTALMSFGNATAHGDREVVAPAELVRPCRVLLSTVLGYLQR